MRAAVACQHVALSAFPSLLDKPLVAGRRVAPVADTLPPYFPVGQVALAVAPACGHSVGSGRSGSSCSVGPAAVPPPGPASLRPVPAGRSWRSGASPGSCSGVLGAFELCAYQLKVSRLPDAIVWPTRTRSLCTASLCHHGRICRCISN